MEHKVQQPCITAEKKKSNLLLICFFYEQGFPDSHSDSVYPQNLVPDPQKLGARILSDEYMINPKLYLFIIYGFLCISGSKGKNHKYFGKNVNFFNTTNP